jgi:hypothetical protein
MQPSCIRPVPRPDSSHTEIQHEQPLPKLLLGRPRATTPSLLRHKTKSSLRPLPEMMLYIKLDSPLNLRQH